MQKRTLSELMDSRYGDRGGWKSFVSLANSELPYEHKLTSIKEQYRVSRDTASKWYSSYKNSRTVV